MFNLPQKEQEILSFWQEKDIFNKLRQKNKNGKHWSFLDGPITANNPMGIHHGWGRTLKDLFQRYHAMKGEKLRYQNGFDCQGLWVEVEVEKELGFKNKKDIENYGIDKFVEKCKKRVEKYSKIQTEQSKRLGYWMDWDNSYYTMSDENNYTIWYFLKKVWQGGNLYKGRDSVPWCPRCGTAISQHEILTEEYKEITHKSIYFKLPVVGKENEYFLVWTTTPWTLPGNVALAVGEEIEYVKVKLLKLLPHFSAGSANFSSLNKAKASANPQLKLSGRKDEYLILSKNLLHKIDKEKKYEIVEEFKGKDLEGLEYKPLFDFHIDKQDLKWNNAYKVYTSDLVTTDEGTGIVHIAPGCGAEDFQLGKERNLPVIELINEEAVYLGSLGEFSGQNAKKNPEIIFDYLKNPPSPRLRRTVANEKYVFKIEDYKHRYPTCWRCKEELVWRVVDEWYISMQKLRYSMMEVAKKINWIPEFGLDRELDWLKNMHDWLISKKRYWGLALPIWECECGYFEVIGSKEELKEKAVKGWEDFKDYSPHRPWIDNIKIRCPKCGKIISRIPDVGNPWLDAGIVPFSTFIDPETKKISYLDDKKYWQKWFPTDFITECFPGQFKNWFYSLIAMSTVLENSNPFKTLLGHALVKDEKGEEMHKSKGNAIWFDDAVEQMGADVIRWMYTSNNPAIDLRFGYHKGEEVRRKIFIPLLNIVNFYLMFNHMNIFENKAKEFANTLNDFDKFNILDRWIMAKMNLLVKNITQKLDEYNFSSANRELEKFINDLSVWYIRRSRGRFKGDDVKDKNQAIYTLGKVLFELTKLLAPFTPFIAEYIYQELGKECGSLKESVHLEDWPEYKEELIDQKVLDNMEMTRKIVELGLAKRAEAGIKIRQPLKKFLIFIPYLIRDQFSNEYVELIKDELNVKEVIFKKNKTGELSVELSTEITPELKQEGYYRELVRKINDLRKKMRLTIKDRIKIEYNTKDEMLKNVFEKYQKELLKQTLADEIKFTDKELEKVDVNDVDVGLRIKNH